MDISVVIPAYNESEVIKITIQEILSTLNRIPDIDKTEIIVVDDHSSDNTFDIIKDLNDPRVKCLRLSRRSGSHIALRAGIKEATGDIVLCISGDGQDDPNCIKGMLKEWQNGAQVVWALRRNRSGEPWYIRKPAKSFYRFLIWLGGTEDSKFDLSRADFYLLDRIVVGAINACSERNTSLFGLIAWMGFLQGAVEYDRRLRRFGRSKWSFRNKFRLAKDWIIAFSGLPLKLISIIGMIIASLGFIYAIFIIIKTIKGRVVEGWASTIVVILVLGGIQMVMTGIIGEYLWRNIEEARNRPLYFIEKET